MSDRPRPTDSGVALVMVLGTFLTLFAVVLATTLLAVNAVRPAAEQLHWEQAGAAAESGLADYAERLRADPGYWETVDCQNPALTGQPADLVPHTCPWRAGEIGWAAVEAGADPDLQPAYHYELTQTAVESGNQANSITVAVTGRSGTTHRTLEARLTRASSADYLYSADYWLIDPAFWSENTASSTPLSPQCGGSTPELTRYYQSRTTSCANEGVLLGANESMAGDVLVNDAARLNGGVITGQFSTAYEACQRATSDPATWTALCLRNSETYSGMTTFSGTRPAYTTPKTLPDSTSTLASLPGCHYYGATRIVLLGDGGRMRVWSRDSGAATAVGAPLAVPDPAGRTPDCGDVSALASAAGQVVDVPNSMVVYVADVPDSADVPNEPIAAGAIGGNSTYGYLPIGGYDGSPPAGTTSTTTVDPDMMLQRKYRTRGNLYLEGSLDGFVTMSASGSVVLTGDLLLAGGMAGDDMAGLIAGHSVEIYRPVTRTLSAAGTGAAPAWRFSDMTTTSTALTWAGSRTSGTVGAWPHRYPDADRHVVYPGDGLQIQASVQALTHAMYVQQYWAVVAGADPQRSLVVQGSIATRYVGITTSQNYGYQENHRYDPRLAFQTPPYLSRFEESGWETGAVGETRTPERVRG